jgi:hypothetical protein
MPAPMPLEFALRPRFRLQESVAPPRRSRPKVPRVILPIAGYWLGMAVLTHALIIAAKSQDGEQGESYEPLQEQAYVSPEAPPPQVEPPALEPVSAPEPPSEPPPAVLETPAEEPIARPLERAEETCACARSAARAAGCRQHAAELRGHRRFVLTGQ